MPSSTKSPVTGDRVRRYTRESAQSEIDRRTARQVRLYAGQSRDVIDERLRELDREWDIERVLEANASGLALTGVVLAATRGRGWLLLSAGVLGFLMQHAVQGWCPPMPVLRRLGIRTQREIERERYALKALRGDFDAAHSGKDDAKDADAVCEAVNIRNG